MELHRTWERIKILYDKACSNQFDDNDEIALDQLDSQITDILLQGKKQCAKTQKSRDPWSPALVKAGQTISYWESKVKML